MPRDTDVPHSGDVHATVRLRKDRWELMTRIVGAATPNSRADLLGVDRKTIYRATMQGVFGLAFMARTVSALSRHSDLLAECGMTPTLDELFEVVDGELTPDASDVDALERSAA
jgi:hypothetical protein